MRARGCVACAVVGAVVAAGAPARAFATDYFVSTSGSNNASGTSKDAPFKTIGRALSLVNPGDTIYVRPGTYSAAHVASRDGTAEAPIRLVGDVDGAIFGVSGAVTLSWNQLDALVVTADYFELHNIRFAGTRIGVTWTNASGGRMVGCTLDGCHGMNMLANGSEVSFERSLSVDARGPGITVGSGSRVLITDSEVRASSHDGIVVATGGSAEVVRCDIGSNRHDGIDVQGGSAVVVSCLVSGNSNSGISVSSGSGATLAVWNSTVVSNKNSGVNAAAGTSLVKNCILTHNSNYGIRAGGAVDAGYNLYFGNKSGVVQGITLSATDITADPLFADKARYTLDAASPAANAGTTPDVRVASDLLGRARPGGGRYDLGAYETDAPTDTAVVPVRVVRWREVGADEE